MLFIRTAPIQVPKQMLVDGNFGNGLFPKMHARRKLSIMGRRKLFRSKKQAGNPFFANHLVSKNPRRGDGLKP